MNDADKELRSHFEFVDLDGNGAIDLQEFSALVRELGMRRSGEVVAHAFQDIDRDGSGSIDFEEFSAWWRARGGNAGAEPSSG